MSAAEPTIEQAKPPEKAVRLCPEKELGDDLLELAAEDDLSLIRNGNLQFWCIGDFCGTFLHQAPVGNWYVELHGDARTFEEYKRSCTAILTAFWDAQKPEIITTTVARTAKAQVFMTSLGFSTMGELFMASGDQLIMGWRKCH
ncbi:MAG: hypothetical protein AB3N23_10890 [Paracoccaceae bacterium]